MSEAPVVAPYIIAGREAAAVLTPRSLAELQAIVASSDGATLVPVAGRTRVSLGNAPTGQFQLLDLDEAITGTIEHQPDDMTLTVPATATIASINAQLAASRQQLTIDPPHPARATVGGTLSVGSGGPLRGRYGLPRDAVLGMTVLRADGELVHAGGRVVKNVTGYDLMRTWTGALGTLGIIISANFRVQPIPECIDLTSRGISLSEALAATDALIRNDARPEIVEIVASGDRWRLHTRIPAPLGGLALDSLPDPGEEDDETWLAASRDLGFGEDDAATIRVAAPFSRLEGIMSLLHDLEPSETVVRPTGSAIIASWKQDATPPVRAAAPTIERIRRELTAAGGSVTVERMPGSWRQEIDPWGEPPGSFPIMQRLKGAYDPGRRLNAGRFIGGI